jgi:hypothetical protein
VAAITIRGGHCLLVLRVSKMKMSWSKQSTEIKHMTIKKRKSKSRPAPPPLKTYIVINDADGNDSFEVEAESDYHAHIIALQELGWWVSTPA